MFTARFRTVNHATDLKSMGPDPNHEAYPFLFGELTAREHCHDMPPLMGHHQLSAISLHWVNTSGSMRGGHGPAKPLDRHHEERRAQH